MTPRFEHLPLVGLLLAGCVAPSGQEQETPVSQPSSTQQTHYPRQAQRTFAGTEDKFTGAVRVKVLFPQNGHTSFGGAYVTFQPGARSAWHRHPAGQHLVVTEGVCWTGTRDGRVLECQAGDALWCPPGVDHWHGATPERAMTHLVVTGAKEGENVVWKELVRDDEYLAGRSPAKKELDVDAHLSAEQQALVPIAAFAASGELERLKPALAAGLAAGLTVNELREVLVHLYAYAGFPRSLNALGAFLALLEERQAQGIRDEVGRDATPLPPGTDPLALGEQVQTELVGRPVSGPLFDFAPVINVYLKSHLFGDIFGRDVLDRRSRELVTVSALSNLEGVGSQLRSHLAVSLNVGLTKEQLRAAALVFEQQVGPLRHPFQP